MLYTPVVPPLPAPPFERPLKSIRIPLGYKLTSPLQESVHHRRPRRWGGNGKKRNLQRLTKIEHDAWHRLFNHMTVDAIAQQINAWRVFDFLVTVMPRSDEAEVLQQLAADFPHGLPAPRCPPRAAMTPKQVLAWKCLWGASVWTPEKMLSDINAHFLDPAYLLVPES